MRASFPATVRILTDTTSSPIRGAGATAEVAPLPLRLGASLWRRTWLMTAPVTENHHDLAPQMPNRSRMVTRAIRDRSSIPQGDDEVATGPTPERLDARSWKRDRHIGKDEA